MIFFIHNNGGENLYFEFDRSERRGESAGRGENGDIKVKREY